MLNVQNGLLRAGRAAALALTALVMALQAPTSAMAVDASCQLKYPIVLSHLWSTGPICGNPSQRGALSCENVQDYERYCAQKSIDAAGERKCLQWRVPDDEADLPPRDYNVNDPTLVRDLRANGRYFSKAIVDRLTATCGNKVYIADKPPFASYEVRARVLRTTVLQALRETGAAKVNLIGVSQGVQDARYMAMALPLDENQPNGPKMGSKVAGIVSLVGEDGGTDSATIGLETIFATVLGSWSTAPKDLLPIASAVVSSGSWKKRGQPMDQAGVLVENCRNAMECDLSQPINRYRWFLRSTVDLSTTFMRPNLVQEGNKILWGWDSLRAWVGEPYKRWSDVVSPTAEAASGIRYMAYGAVLRYPNPAWSGQLGFYGVVVFSGENDSNVSLYHQMFRSPSGNFENVKVMRGAPLTTGYHHTFFTGHNDALYSSMVPSEQEPAPYGGGSVNFYHQLARDMQARGL